MSLSNKWKNIYNLRHNAYLTVFNVISVGLIALWIAIFVQTNMPMRYKLLISATIINMLILLSVYLISLIKKLESKILNL